MVEEDDLGAAGGAVLPDEDVARVRVAVNVAELEDQKKFAIANMFETEEKAEEYSICTKFHFNHSCMIPSKKKLFCHQKILLYVEKTFTYNIRRLRHLCECKSQKRLSF